MAARENLLRSSCPDDIAAKLLLDDAHRNPRLNRRDAEAFGHVPVPASAVYVWHWDSDDESGRWQCALEGPSWRVDELCIDMLGTQTADGAVTRRLVLESTDPTLSGNAAQQLGRAIAAAVADLARLEGSSATGAGQ